jgi:hypothetical protein
MSAGFSCQGSGGVFGFVRPLGIRGTVPQVRRLRSALHLTMLISALFREHLDITEANMNENMGFK